MEVAVEVGGGKKKKNREEKNCGIRLVKICVMEDLNQGRRKPERRKRENEGEAKTSCRRKGRRDIAMIYRKCKQRELRRRRRRGR